jgi:predicted amidohydrolase YtcJ
MRRAGITKDTKDPQGGEIGRDTSGNATGFFSERAQGLIRAALSRDGGERTDPDKVLKLAADEALHYGITTFEDAGSGWDVIARMRKLSETGQLPIRLWVMARTSIRDLESGLKANRSTNDSVTVRAIKMAIDGALGSRGAWLLEPYADLPSTSGLNTTSLKEIERVAELAIQNDYQLCVHAIGDRGNREVLDIYERTFKKYPDKKDLRWRIEHAQHLHPADIPRFGKLGVIASMQGVHCTTDAPMVIPRLGPKRAEEGAYVWQSLMKSGAHVINGTDAPVDDLSPFASFYASVTRHPKGMTPFFPQQKMSRMEALRSYTIEAAWAGFLEGSRGSLSPGKLADVTVLTRDILTIPEEDILKTEAEFTIVGGKVAYRRSK